MIRYGLDACAAVAAVVGLLYSGIAQERSRPTPMPLWNGVAPGAKGQEPDDIPSIAVYRPSGNVDGAAFVICPGGGYAHLADHEGHNIALWLNEHGITGVVLTYRLGPKYNYPAPVQDVARAIRTVRARATEWGIDPNRIGVWGSSAGGHLASTIATQFDRGDPAAADPIDRLSSRPDIAVLAYPVISMMPGITHQGSRQNLLGSSPSPALEEALSSEKHVTAETPPTFLFHTADDSVVPVENSVRFATALRAAKVPYELHIFEKGRHGVGLAQDNPALGVWPTLLYTWLRARGFVK